MQEDSEQDNSHFSVLDQRKSGMLSVKIVHKVNEWDKMAERMMITLAESGHPVFRATSPLSRGQLKSKGGGKMSIHYCADLETITTVFRTITSVNQLSIYGAVAEMCEEYESYHAGRPVVGEQSSSSFVPNVINTNVLLNNDDPTHKETKIHLNRRVGSEETSKLGLYWKLQPVACKVNTELRFELCL